ncbi:small redox-active disulfide protein 2 [Cohaesibacter sp. ES.047]|uniref:thioredoxin family protein n=1 Tax=Cohaesibacter sp. ES.047 TaxID=1798205 RepID=UPI000BB936F5|nr:thioredoxin family protein [Cohaesibacter sp. ES.047]SNY90883.1 small redox-active disulfide protein 2 [Cohaesibacter sp. ES.047]
MKSFQVLGSGCRNCVKTAEQIEQKAAELGIEAKVEKVTDMADILGYGVMSTPGVVLNGQVVHAGGVPNVSLIISWLRE